MTHLKNEEWLNPECPYRSLPIWGQIKYWANCLYEEKLNAKCPTVEILHFFLRPNHLSWIFFRNITNDAKKKKQPLNHMWLEGYRPQGQDGQAMKKL